MILVDANLLIHATTPGLLQPKAAKWLEDQFWSAPRVGLPWAVLLAWLRLITNRRIFAAPLPMDDAWSQVEEWLALESVWVPEPTERHAGIMRTLLKSGRVTDSNLVPDVHLAALAVEHGLELCSTDGDFARFRDVRWVNPLEK